MPIDSQYGQTLRNGLCMKKDIQLPPVFLSSVLCSLAFRSPLRTLLTDVEIMQFGGKNGKMAIKNAFEVWENMSHTNTTRQLVAK